MAVRSIEEARKLLSLNWHQVNGIKKRPVALGPIRRDKVPIRNTGLDEKQFRCGHSYISSLVDLEDRGSLQVVEEQIEEFSKKVPEVGLSEVQREQVEALALDMWPSYANAVEALLPNAAIVHDRFNGSRYLWLTSDKNLNE